MQTVIGEVLFEIAFLVFKQAVQINPFKSKLFRIFVYDGIQIVDFLFWKVRAYSCQLSSSSHFAAIALSFERLPNVRRRPDDWKSPFLPQPRESYPFVHKVVTGLCGPWDL